jgi:hypothetical protein
MAAHQLIQTGGGGCRCLVCQWSWLGAPLEDCPRVPRYVCGEAPAGLVTLRELERRGLRLTEQQPVRGCFWSHRKRVWVWLHDLWETMACIRGSRHLADLEEVRAEHRANAVAWAAGLLAEPETWVVLGAAGTGMTESDQTTQLGVLHPSGQVLLDSLIRPRFSIPCEAAVDGIMNQVGADALSPAVVWSMLEKIVAGRRVIAYQRLGGELLHAERWMPPRCGAQWSYAMMPYAAYCGHWPDDQGSYRSLPLPHTDHTVLGDCWAILRVICEMGAAGHEIRQLPLLGMEFGGWRAWLPQVEGGGAVR